MPTTDDRRTARSGEGDPHQALTTPRGVVPRARVGARLQIILTADHHGWTVLSHDSESLVLRRGTEEVKVVFHPNGTVQAAVAAAGRLPDGSRPYWLLGPTRRRSAVLAALSGPRSVTA